MCVHRESGAQRAVKVLRKSHMDDDEKRMLFNEINILKEIVSATTETFLEFSKIMARFFLSLTNFCFFQDHPNIIKMYEFFEDEKRYYLVTE